MISDTFIDRPRLAGVIAVVITIAGLLALTRIPVAQLPDIVPPQVQVTATYPGASAAVVEASVAQPIEAQVVGVDKMIYMKSTSGNDGSYSLTVSFDLGTDPDINTVNVNNRVQTALAQLPAEVQLEGLTVQKKSSAVLQFLSLYSENGQQDPLFITNYAVINIIDVLSRVPGVGQARIFGALNYSMRIWFDTKRLDNLSLTPADLISAIQAQNVQAPVGRIGARPIAHDQQFQINIETKGRLKTPEQFGDIVLRANPDGSMLRVRDVARVELGAQNEDVEGRYNGEPAVALGLYLSPGANAVNTASAVIATMDRLSKRFPPGLHYVVNYDTTTFVRATIHDVLVTLAIAFGLVVIVVFVFLGSLRATLIPAIAVPVSLIGAFAVLLVLGYSANTVSLLAMVLAIGILVDDAIVVVENVERVLEENPQLTPSEATKQAMTEITAPIIAITLVLLSVFVPVAFIPGISGQLFRQFAVTISVAMLISALNALTLSPALCALFLRHHGVRRGPMGWVLRRIDNVRDGYAAIVRRLVRLSIFGLLLVAVSAGAIAMLTLRTPTGFLPEEDQGAFFVNVQLPDGASVYRTREAVSRITKLLQQMPQVDKIFSINGFSIIDGVNEPNTGFIVALLKPFEDRAGAAELGAGADRPRLRRGPRSAYCQRFRLQPAADHRSVDDGRLRIRPGSVGGPGARRDEQRYARAHRQRQWRPPAYPRVLDLHRQQPLDLSRHRPRKGAGAGTWHERRLRRVAGHAGGHLYQQLQSLRARLAGQYPGRGGRPPRRVFAVADLHPQQIRHRCPAPVDR